MFPVKLWISPQRTHQCPPSLQATHKTRGLHAAGFLLNLTVPFARSVIPKQHALEFCVLLINGTRHQFYKREKLLREWPPEPIRGNTVSDTQLPWLVDTLGLKIPNTFRGWRGHPEHEPWDLEIPVEMGPVNKVWFHQLRKTRPLAEKIWQLCSSAPFPILGNREHWINRT